MRCILNAEMHLKTGVNDDMRRLDRILRKALPDYSLSLIHRLLRQGKILVNGKPARAHDRVPAGAEITVPDTRESASPHSPSPTPHSSLPHSSFPIPHSPFPTPHSPASTPRSPIPILWQDSNLLILNKPAGLAVHGPESLDALVQHYLAGRMKPEDASLSFRSGPLHRLDRQTSGAIAFSLSLAGAREFSSRLWEGKIRKQYLAVVEGCLNKREIWSDSLVRDKTRKISAVAQNAEKGAAALTTVQPLAVSIAPYRDRFTLILAEIHTGRTHQIRAQAAAHGHPLMGDTKYGSRSAAPVLESADGSGAFFLHAWKLTIDENAPVSAPLPQAFESLIKTLFGLNSDLADSGLLHLLLNEST